MKNGLKFYVKKNIQIVCNDRSNEEWAEILCKKEHRIVCNDNEELTEVLCKNVKKNMQIFWNDNEEWAEFFM